MMTTKSLAIVMFFVSCGACYWLQNLQYDSSPPKMRKGEDCALQAGKWSRIGTGNVVVYWRGDAGEPKSKFANDMTPEDRAEAFQGSQNTSIGTGALPAVQPFKP